ncbi:phage tail tube protein [Brevundimonas naejangsanensis]|uniref:phage tail tube protein n=1 Tax=Brevundimonas naejangsanensis TaxID=588932 RepID=UPI00320B55B4
MAVKTKNNVGLRVNLGSGGTPNWKDVKGAFTLDGGGTTTDRIDATTFASPGNSRVYIGGLSEENPISYEMNYEPGDETQVAIRSANAAGDSLEFQMVFGVAADPAKAEAYTVPCLVSSYGLPTGPIDGKLSVPVQLTPTQAGEWGPVVP